MWSYRDKNTELIRILVLCISLSGFLFLPTLVFAQSNPSTNFCQETGIVLGFFNGVQTTPDGAYEGLLELRKLYGATSSSGDRIHYEPFYNYSKGLEDFVETFEQRLLEQDGLLLGRYELFFEVINGQGQDSWWSTIIDSVPAARDILSALVDQHLAALARQLTTLFFTNPPPTALNYAGHRARLDTLIREGYKFLFVAHSQGNLFADVAYKHVRETVSEESIKIVHIAPASPELHGKHVLALLDLVINLLRVTGSVPDNTDNIPVNRPPGSNGKTDPLGHGLIEIYLNPALDPVKRITTYINEALNTLVAPRAVAKTGFFTASLIWDGAGDVDLHTFEPGGAHVYYRQRQGVAGELDRDNRLGFGPGLDIGPEHYYASCDSNVLQPGTYRIAIANFARAEGRTATVQIASWKDGVLGEMSVTLGDATRDTPSFYAFRITLLRDSPTAKYLIFVEEE